MGCHGRFIACKVISLLVLFKYSVYLSYRCSANSILQSRLSALCSRNPLKLYWQRICFVQFWQRNVLNPWFIDFYQEWEYVGVTGKDCLFHLDGMTHYDFVRPSIRCFFYDLHPLCYYLSIIPLDICDLLKFNLSCS